MKIRTKLALRFTIIVATLLLIFASAVYYFSSIYRQEEFNLRLRKKAGNSARLLSQTNEGGENLLQIIDKYTVSSLPELEVSIYGGNGELLYSNTSGMDMPQVLTWLDQIRTEKEVYFKKEHKESVGIFSTFNNRVYLTIVSSFDSYGFNKLKHLRYILIFSWIAGVLLAMLMGWIYSLQALKPISAIVSEVKKISASNLSQRLPVVNRSDEMGQLAVTFNRMLFRVERAFELQKSFVAHASHELRTPLTAASGQLEVALMKKRSEEEYREIISSIYDDIKRLTQLSNGLIDLAHASVDISKLSLGPIRVDELLWSIEKEIVKANPGYTVSIDIIDLPAEESEITVLGSEQLLKSALLNVADNACKFSRDKKVNIEFRIKKKNIHLLFKDRGIGISQKDIDKIFQPFYRASNTSSYPGNGLGLALTQRIIEKHGGSMKVKSVEGEYTHVEITLPSVA